MAQRLSWKETSRRRSGPEGYKFGDVTRTIFFKAKRAFRQASMLEYGSGQQRLPVLLFRSFGDVLDGGSAGSSQELQPIEQKLWLNLLNACYFVAIRALKTGLLSIEEVEDEEAFLYIGIPALALIECCLRSAGRDGSLVLFDGSSLHRGAISSAAQASDPESASNLEQTLDLLKEIESALGNTPANDAVDKGNSYAFLASADSVNILRVKALRASGDAFRAADATSEAALNKLCGMALSIATQVSQQSFYRGAFAKVLRAAEKYTSKMHSQHGGTGADSDASTHECSGASDKDVDEKRTTTLALFGKELLRRSLSAEDD
jgi:hypothetical protein